VDIMLDPAPVAPMQIRNVASMDDGETTTDLSWVDRPVFAPVEVCSDGTSVSGDARGNRPHTKYVLVNREAMVQAMTTPRSHLTMDSGLSSVKPLNKPVKLKRTVTNSDQDNRAIQPSESFLDELDKKKEAKRRERLKQSQYGQVEPHHRPPKQKAHMATNKNNANSSQDDDSSLAAVLMETDSSPLPGAEESETPLSTTSKSNRLGGGARRLKKAFRKLKSPTSNNRKRPDPPTDGKVSDPPTVGGKVGVIPEEEDEDDRTTQPTPENSASTVGPEDDEESGLQLSHTDVGEKQRYVSQEQCSEYEV